MNIYKNIHWLNIDFCEFIQSLFNFLTNSAKVGGGQNKIRLVKVLNMVQLQLFRVKKKQ